MTNLIDNTVVPKGRKWEFDEAVTARFDNMLSRSIPGIGDMRHLTYELAVRCPSLSWDGDGGVLIDYGCSNGAAMFGIAKSLERLHCIGIDNSEPMIAEARSRALSGFPGQARFEFHTAELVDFMRRNNYNGDDREGTFDINLCVLTGQFVPIELRQEFMRRMFDATVQNGMVIYVEKVLGDTPALQDIFVETYHDFKRNNGYTDEEISSKAESLRGVLVPMTADANIKLLKTAGWGNVECFWRSLNFAGFVGYKDLK